MKHVRMTKTKQTSVLCSKDSNWLLSAYEGPSVVTSSSRKNRCIRKLAFSWAKGQSEHFTSGPALNLTGPHNVAIACNYFSGKSWDGAFTALVPHGTEGYSFLSSLN